ncbi:MAG: SAM-dependent methyltransferase [Clostridia bacterium]
MNKEKIVEILAKPIYFAVISQKKKTSQTEFSKIEIKSFEKNSEILYQFSSQKLKQVFHKNLNKENAIDYIVSLLENDFQQCVIFSSESDYHITSFNGKFKIKTSKATKSPKTLSHDRTKNYIIPADADFLFELGISTKNGEIKKEKYAKYRQINRYLEFVDNIKESFPKNKTIRVVDFGCGKAYLSFALYYYLKVKLNLDVKIIGLDLKKDVVEYCDKLARKLSYDGLNFYTGDIGQYNSDDGFDMVISLHACDTATDEAIYKGILWKSKIIFAVPCCQHELNPQLKNEDNNALLRYGLMRERLATLITDTYRTLLLETRGYKCDMAEFIETEHTPKNVLIRAVYTGDKSKKAKKELETMKSSWNFTQHLENILEKGGI